MTARRSVAKRGTVADRALVPPLADAGGPQPSHRLVELLSAVGAPADVRERHLGTLGELERVMEPIAPGPQVHRLTLLRRLLQTDELGPERERLLRNGRSQLDVGQLRQQAHGDLSSRWGRPVRRLTRIILRIRLHGRAGRWGASRCRQRWRTFQRAMRTNSSGTG